MRLRSWKQLEELLEFIRESRNKETFNSDYGYTSKKIAKGISEDLSRRNLTTEIGHYEVFVHSIDTLTGNIVIGYRNLKEVQLRLIDSRGCVGIYRLYHLSAELVDDE